MSHQQIYDTVRELLLPYVGLSCTIERNSDLFQDLFLNSLDLINIISLMEERFHMDVSDESISQIHKVDDIVTYIFEQKQLEG